MIRRPPRSTLFPTRRSSDLCIMAEYVAPFQLLGGSFWSADTWLSTFRYDNLYYFSSLCPKLDARSEEHTLNSSHMSISYAVFCLKKKKNNNTTNQIMIYKQH